VIRGCPIPPKRDRALTLFRRFTFCFGFGIRFRGGFRFQIFFLAIEVADAHGNDFLRLGDIHDVEILGSSFLLDRDGLVVGHFQSFIERLALLDQLGHLFDIHIFD